MSRPATLALWSMGLTLALGLHAAGAFALLARWHDEADTIAGAPTIMLELAPVAVAPAVTQNDIPPGPQQDEAQAKPDPVKPVDTVALQPAAQAELQITPPPKPIEKPKDKEAKKKHASLASTPSTAERKAERAAAPAPGANARSDALP